MTDEINYVELMAQAPENFVIRNAIERCFDEIKRHNRIICSISGGADSDVMLDMLWRCGASQKTDFVFFDTGIEYSATKEHLCDIEQKYGVEIKRLPALKPVPVGCREYGVPFWSKYASDMIQRLQSHGFRFEDRPFDELILEYPHCKTALEWWCDRFERSDQYSIARSPYLKEFLVQNPPTFRISSTCCKYAKKNVAKKAIKNGGYDLICTGIRQSEGGVRAATYKTCFSVGDDIDSFRPIFYLRDKDKLEYCEWYRVTHSRCYTEYGLQRTGCFGCPFGKRFEEELSAIEKFEPRLVTAANHIFGESYEYTRRYLSFRETMKKMKLSGIPDSSERILGVSQ